MILLNTPEKKDRCDYRNEVIHVLLNRKNSGIRKKSGNQAVNEMKYAGVIESRIRIKETYTEKYKFAIKENQEKRYVW